MSDHPDVPPRLAAALEGRYRIERELGAGGMATVYLAQDVRHNRPVAIKVLRPDLAAMVGAERFLAEIETTANLRHPHILPLFDSGESEGFIFYVMPYVEGESLRDRLERERQLPVDEAVGVASKVAAALDYAHRHGVVHRDIKPANILLEHGEPVVADFGIALAVGAAGGGRLTETGMSLGTPHYMSPEQATGDQSVGTASDVYALGCVLYEMLVGEPPYTGATAQAVLGRIITGSPDPVTEHRKAVPPNVEAAVNRALEKVPADRFTSATEFARALADPGFRHGSVAGPSVAARAEGWKRMALAAWIVTLLTVGVAAALLLSGTEPGVSTAPVVRFTVPVGEDAELWLGGPDDTRWGWPSATSLALSPDGELLVYSGWRMGPDGGVDSRLYIRRLDLERADPIEGSEGASIPFFSPDGAWIGFFAGSSLRRVPAGGGSAETVVQDADVAPFPRGAAWGDDGSIFFGGSRGIYRVAGGGGRAELVAETPPEAYRYAQPLVLPGSDVVLFHAMGSLNPEDSEIVALEVATGERITLLAPAADPRWLASGQLLFLRQGTLMAVELDPESLEPAGEPVPVLEDVMQAVGMPNTGWETWAGQVAVSPSGHLAYVRGGIYPDRPTALVRVSADGVAEPLDLEEQSYGYGGPRVSPDGDRLAFYTRMGRGGDIYVRDLGRGATRRLNTGGFANRSPVWSPDGGSVLFTSDREDGVANVYVLDVDGSGEPERVAPSRRSQRSMDWSAEGVVAYLEGGDIQVLPPGGEPAPFFTSPAEERYVAFSPDGRWMAYASDESGRTEVYVRPYPGPDPATLVSAGGGQAPAWSPDGGRIYFVQEEPTGQQRMMVVDVEAGEPFRVGRATPYLDPWPYITTTPATNFDVLADGSFVAVRAVDLSVEDLAPGIRPERSRFAVGDLHVVLNWSAELGARLGGGGGRSP